MKIPMVLRADGAAVAARRAHRRPKTAVRRHLDLPHRAGAGGSDLTITEDGEVYNVIFRFMSRFVFGHHATMDAFLKNLQARTA